MLKKLLNALKNCLNFENRSRGSGFMSKSNMTKRSHFRHEWRIKDKQHKIVVLGYSIFVIKHNNHMWNPFSCGMQSICCQKVTQKHYIFPFSKLRYLFWWTLYIRNTIFRHEKANFTKIKPLKLLFSKLNCFQKVFSPWLFKSLLRHI